MKTSLKLISFLIVSSFLFSVASCSSDDKDNGELKIKYFVLSSDELLFDILASEQIVEVKTNLKDVTVEVSENWCRAELEEKQLKVNVDNCDESIDERKAEITLTASGETRTLIVTQSALNDLKLTVASAQADYFHSANPIQLSFDNDYGTYFMSHWSQTKFPFDVVYNFEDVKTMDFFVYYPRPGGEKKNGLLGKLEVWYATKSNSEFTKYGDYDFEEGASEQKITFTPALSNPTQIKFVLYQGYGTGTYAAIGEMEFYKAGKKK